MASRAERQRLGALVLLVGAVMSAAPASAQEPPDAPVERQVTAPSRTGGATIARIVVPTLARPRPAARRGARRLAPQTVWSGQQQSLLVLGSAKRAGRTWVKVLLPVRPNGTTAWVARNQVVLNRSSWWVDVRTGARRVTVYHRGRRVRSFRAVVGAPSTPTPHGLAAIYERNRQPNPDGFLGPWALPLTAFSNVLEDYGGGPGRVAIHGRAAASLRDPLGSARSHGCVRLANRHIAWLAKTVRSGTPVRLRP